MLLTLFVAVFILFHCACIHPSIHPLCSQLHSLSSLTELELYANAVLYADINSLCSLFAWLSRQRVMPLYQPLHMSGICFAQTYGSGFCSLFSHLWLHFHPMCRCFTADCFWSDEILSGAFIVPLSQLQRCRICSQSCWLVLQQSPVQLDLYYFFFFHMFCFNRQWPPFKMEPSCQKCFWRTTDTLRKICHYKTAAVVCGCLAFEYRPQNTHVSKCLAIHHIQISLYTHIAFMQLPDRVHTTMEALFFYTFLQISQSWVDEMINKRKTQNYTRMWF